MIPLGVPRLGDDARMPPAVDAAIGGSPFVLAIATLEPRKNLPHLVSAFGLLAAGTPTFAS